MTSVASDPRQVTRLNCLVLGEPRNRIFPVKIASTDTVGDLKDAIKEKKQLAFQHIDADSVVLWKVSISPNQTVPLNLDELQVDANDITLLSPTDGLSEVFSESLAPKDIHVIVKSPTLGE
jgi:Crinkler effector protein N-terminal domain